MRFSLHLPKTAILALFGSLRVSESERTRPGTSFFPSYSSLTLGPPVHIRPLAGRDARGSGGKERDVNEEEEEEEHGWGLEFKDEKALFQCRGGSVSGQ